MQRKDDQRLLFKEIASMTGRGNQEGALRLLAEALRSRQLDAEGCEKAGRLITSFRSASKEEAADVRVMFLGQCTTAWLANSITAIAWGRGCALAVRQGEYDNVIQELMARVPQDRPPDIVILLPWNQRLLHDQGDRSAPQRVEDELAFWRQAWNLVRERTGASILQVGYDWETPGPLGHHLGSRLDGNVGLIRQVNDALRSALPGGSFFLDLEQVSGMVGRDRFYDARRYFWTKQPFSEAAVHELAAHLWAGIRALRIGPKKVLVVDLDNTLWGGVVGEVGPLGIGLGETPDGEAFRAFQKHLKALCRRGVVLAICSKNNRDDALAPFEQNPQMALTLGDFACVEASWEPKSIGLRNIAETLNLGLDSFVFFDDNPAEREEIRRSLPEVEVVDVPHDAAEYIEALRAGLWFEAADVSNADLQRSEQYQNEHQRREAQKQTSSMGEYFQSLYMRGSISPVDDICIQRVIQLIARTNQFNLTTRRHNIEDVRRLLMVPGSIGLALNLTDRFGDHGLISVLLCAPEPAMSGKTLRIDTWLMSCRVVSRTAEGFLFNELLDRARALGYEWLEGEYIPTRKNSLVADLFEHLNFTRIQTAADGTTTWRLAIARATPVPTFVISADPVLAAST